jgi:hypothetical protein
MLPPLFDQDLRFFQAVEDFAVQQFIPEAGIEAFAIAVFPRAARFDVGRFGTNGSDPVPYSLGNELRAIAPMEVSTSEVMAACAVLN